MHSLLCIAEVCAYNSYQGDTFADDANTTTVGQPFDPCSLPLVKRTERSYRTNVNTDEGCGWYDSSFEQPRGLCAGPNVVEKC